ncbi:ComEC/Rec2 family competence protein [Desulfuribacillus stibiiarsenatis]|uniref:ComEC/Rec2 family competence protein n=1 Tax=Desulfuribacillus stibiiarsenatis TaxID=1390249 RepID=UPI0015B6AE96|nr:ComEC/Rec2 family competence protein [Desulfuribacillus stibiiarsenatis]
MISSYFQNETNTSITSDGIDVYFFDVGQANATLIQGPDFNILIDAGHYQRNDVISHLQRIGIQELDLLIGTHPHADHIGQFDQVLDHYPVKEVWLSGDIHTSKTFEKAIDAIERSGAGYHEPKEGEIHQIGQLTIEVLNPNELNGRFHDGCIAIRAIYKDFSVLLTGDIEANVEERIIKGNKDLQSTVLQLGHHGSKTSTTEAFLKAVNPKVSVYSAGKGNDYGHPHDVVINRLQSLGMLYFGTDLRGTIRIFSDGKQFQIIKER